MIVPDSLRLGFEDERTKTIGSNSIDSVAAAQLCLKEVDKMLGRIERLMKDVEELKLSHVRIEDSLAKSREAYAKIKFQVERGL